MAGQWKLFALERTFVPMGKEPIVPAMQRGWGAKPWLHLKSEISRTMTCWLDYTNQLLSDNTVFSSFSPGDFALLQDDDKLSVTLTGNNDAAFLVTESNKRFLPQLYDTSHKISQRCLSLYINCQDFQICKMTILALIFRNEPQLFCFSFKTVMLTTSFSTAESKGSLRSAC